MYRIIKKKLLCVKMYFPPFKYFAACKKIIPFLLVRFMKPARPVILWNRLANICCPPFYFSFCFVPLLLNGGKENDTTTLLAFVGALNLAKE